MRFPALAILALCTAAVAGAQAPAHWSYEGNTGPLRWSKLDPTYQACGGHEQSPIDIRGAHLNKALAPIEFHYRAGAVKLENNGHTIVVHVNPGSYIVAGGVRYDLEQFHFHHPAEEVVHGKLTEMDAHLVHRSAEGKIAVVAVRFSEDRGSPNAVLAGLWESLPKVAGATEKVADMIDPGGLLPADRGYWTYLGSLTTPPCTEGVRWFVMEQDMSVSRDQWRRFAAIFPVNSRPVQDAHGRRIEANE